MDRTAHLGEFLRSRRARIEPSDVGLPDSSGRRRVPGLRREELAQIAGVSADYYTRLEQGRSRASPTVLAAIARALRLDDAERAYLFDLAAPAPDRSHRGPAPAQQVGYETYQLLEVLDRALAPAMVIGRRQDVLAANRLHRALVCDFDALPARERNMGRYVFLDPRARDLFADWEIVAGDVAALLRFDLGRHPDDPLLHALITELESRSRDFRRLWAHHKVHERVHGVKRYHHPVAGDFSLTYQALSLPARCDQTLFVYTAEPESPEAAALRLLEPSGNRLGATRPS